MALHKLHTVPLSTTDSFNNIGSARMNAPRGRAAYTRLYLMHSPFMLWVNQCVSEKIFVDIKCSFSERKEVASFV